MPQTTSFFCGGGGGDMLMMTMKRSKSELALAEFVKIGDDNDVVLANNRNENINDKLAGNINDEENKICRSSSAVINNFSHTDHHGIFADDFGFSFKSTRVSSSIIIYFLSLYRCVCMYIQMLIVCTKSLCDSGI